MKNTASQIADAVRANGGATIQLYWNENHIMDARDGDCYAVGGALSVPTFGIPLEYFNSDAVEEQLMRARMAWWDKLEPTSCVGFWVHNDVVHCDLVDAIMGRAYALSVAEERGELAIYSLKDQSEIWTSHAFPILSPEEVA